MAVKGQGCLGGGRQGHEGLLFVAGKGVEACDARTHGSSISKSQFESALIRIEFGEELLL
jgi:hypothetical protein